MSVRPPLPGLYDPRFDHDACGVAFLARLRGGPSHEVVAQGIEALVNLGHRGACGADPDTGDGAGILIQVPDAFLRRASRLSLPPAGAYGVGMAFLPADPDPRADCEAITAGACGDQGLRILGWRDVPADAGGIGQTARASLPV